MESTIREFEKKPALNEPWRKGKEVNLVCNFLKLSFKPQEKKVEQFSIKYEPEIASDNNTLKKKVLRSIVKELRGYYHPYFPAGDTLFTSAINPEEAIVLSTNVDEQEYKVIIEETKNEIDLSKIRRKDESSVKVKSLIEVLVKIILSANTGLVRFDDRNIFDYNNVMKLPEGGAYLMPGYSTSVIITESGLFLRISLKNKFVNGKTCFEKLHELQSIHKNGSFQRAAIDYFSNTSVMTNYGSYKVYKISTINFEINVMNKTIIIKDVEGKEKEITLFQYYKEQYSKIIKAVDQPLLESERENFKGEKEKIYLVPELCLLTGMDDEMRANDNLKKTMTGKTKMLPKERMAKIADIKKLLTQQKKNTRTNPRTKEVIEMQSPNELREQWGLNFGDFKELSGRELETPPIKFRDVIGKVDRGRFRQSQIIHSNGGFGKECWAVVCARENEDNAYSIVDMLEKASKNLAIPIDKPRYYVHSARKREDWIEELRSMDFNGGLKLAFVILDKHSKGYYPSIKEYLYSEIGIPSQMVLAENRSKNLSYYSNVLNQMVVKIGGQLYNIYLDNMLNKNPSMIIGLDSAKHGKGQRKYIITASYDANLCKFYTEEMIVETDQGPVGPIGVMMRRCLDYFSFAWDKQFLPNNIIIYRSGVTEVQKKSILNNEVPIIEKLLSGNDTDCYKKGYEAKFCYIVVNKKTDVKFFEVSNGNLNNPGNGTVVDTQVVSPDLFEFYLQPQFVNQGTATPTHFHVLFDSTGVPLEILENITYKQCYYYWNWPGPIRVPAALKFAETASAFSTKNLKSNTSVNEKLKHTPYYI